MKPRSIITEYLLLYISVSEKIEIVLQASLIGIDIMNTDIFSTDLGIPPFDLQFVAGKKLRALVYGSNCFIYGLDDSRRVLKSGHFSWSVEPSNGQNLSVVTFQTLTCFYCEQIRE